MTKTLAATSAVWLAGFLTLAAATDSARVEVATVDGAPVYHWRTFRGELSDDVDRALVLREFERRGFKLPERLVEQEVQAAIQKKAGGDEVRFSELLRQQGATLADYRSFVAEEITIAAMFYQKTPDVQERERWLAGLRAKAHVNRLRTAPNASK